MNATDSAPAGGAAIGEVILATGGAILATAVLLYLGWAHRTGRSTLLRRLAAFAAKDTGLASWAALPSIVAASSLLIAVLGMYWDISLHIDDGRDAGPLANPAHYLILVGLYGIFAAGFLAIVLPEGRPSRGAVRLSGDWYAPLGGIAMIASSAFALIGFPLDDVWHRIFGQDVTLWGPTHLMLIGGAGLTLIGSCILIVEGRAPRSERRTWRTVIARGRRMFAFGGLLIGLSTFQAEFDFGVPQFNLVLEPVMLAFAAGIALVGARIWIGPGAAIGSALFFIAIRGALALIVGPGFGETTPHFPLYLAEAACVELAVLAIPTRRPYAFGALAGGLIGTVGFAAEYAWSHVWMPIPWPENLIADAWLPVLIAAIAAGLIGGYLASALSGAERGAGVARKGVPERMPSIGPAAAGLAAIAVVVALHVGDSTVDGVRGEVRLTEVSPSPGRTVDATVAIEPPSAVDDPRWVTAIAWQGGEKLHLEHLSESAPGVYETDEPLPVDGTYKALIRVHRDDVLLGLPIFLPQDRAIPAEEVPATPSFERPFIDETEILQRELKDDVPGYLAIVAYLGVGAIVLALIVLLGWVLRRLGRAGDEPAHPERTRARGVGAREVPA
jgi:hypothetical protein